MATQNMVVGLPRVLPPNGIYERCVLRKHNQGPFDSEKDGMHRNHRRFFILIFAT